MTKRKYCNKSDITFYSKETFVIGFLLAIGISAGLWVLLTILGNVCILFDY